MTEKTIYAIELDDIVVWDWEKERDAIYLSLYEAKQEKHKIWWYYKKNLAGMKNVKFKDFKIVGYIKQSRRD